MKYRVVRKEGQYFPQVRVWCFFWEYFDRRIFTGSKVPISFKTQQEAVHFIQVYEEKVVWTNDCKLPQSGLDGKGGI